MVFDRDTGKLVPVSPKWFFLRHIETRGRKFHYMPKKNEGLPKSSPKRPKGQKPSSAKNQPSHPKDENVCAREVEKKFPSSKNQTTDDRFHVVGIGASAGGLTALENLLGHMPEKVNLALVIVQHLDPKRKSIMPTLLGRSTQLPVVHIEDGQKIVPGKIYVKPSELDVVVEKGRFRLKPAKSTDGSRHPIDRFFRSMARDCAENAIVVVLSGAGSDGSLGLKDVKEAGGLVIAQDEREAEYSGMPRSAVDTGLVDLVLPVAGIAEKLIEYVDHPLIVEKEAKDETARERLESETDKILTILRVKMSYDFCKYKRNTVRRRVARRMAVHQITDITEYGDYLREHPEECEELFKDLLINVTSFFRDPAAFEALEKEVLPKLFEKGEPGEDLRVWVPACSTGEEAYSLAILLQEYAERSDQDKEIKIFATDINPEAIDTAREAKYADNISADVSPERLKRFFDKQDSTYRIDRKLRDKVVFAVHDITREAPFSRVDLISCRNMLIYMEPELQRQVVPVFHYSLRNDGFLMLGTSEGIGNLDNLFEVVDKKQRIYRKKTGEGYQHLEQLGLPLSSSIEEKWRKAHHRHQGMPPRAQAKEDVSVTKLLKGLVAGMAPGVVVNEEGEIRYFVGDTQPFLAPPVGEPSFHISDMVREPLGFRISSALEEVGKHGRRVELNDLTVEHDQEYLTVDVKVSPLADLGGYFVVTFHAKPSQKGDEKGQEGEGTEQASAVQSRVKNLEEKLSATRQELQATIEELETSNEELKASNEELQANNEELQSTNEELESSKEELQSTNEELETTNLELHRKNRELVKAEDDIQNLFKSADIGTLFLDKELKIKRFTSKAKQVFNIIESDTGRLIWDITHKLKYENLKSDVRDVLENLGKKELEVETRTGEWLSLRLQPYRTSNDLIDGVVITVTDTTMVKKAEQEAQQMRRALGNIVDTIRQPMAVLDEDYFLQFANDSFFRRFHISPENGVGERFTDLLKGRWDTDALRKNLDRLISGEEKSDIDFPAPFKNGKGEILLGRCIAWEDDRPKLILLTFTKDI